MKQMKDCGASFRFLTKTSTSHSEYCTSYATLVATERINCCKPNASSDIKESLSLERLRNCASGAPVVDFQDDPACKLAMSFGLVACIIGVTAMVALWPITCKPYSKKWIRILCTAVLFAFVSQLITFAMFGKEICKENDCVLHWGGFFPSLLQFSSSLVLSQSGRSPSLQLMIFI
jgi:hypothetical protein